MFICRNTRHVSQVMGNEDIVTIIFVVWTTLMKIMESIELSKQNRGFLRISKNFTTNRNHSVLTFCQTFCVYLVKQM